MSQNEPGRGIARQCMKLGGHGRTAPPVVATVGQDGARMIAWQRTTVGAEGNPEEVLANRRWYEDAPMRPWQVLESVNTNGGVLELRRRGERDFLMTIDGRVLMNSEHHRSEDVLADVACIALGKKRRPRVLLGGLGMGFTLRAALDQLPPKAAVTVVDLNRKVVDWNRGPLGPLAQFPIANERVEVVVDDVAQVIARSRPGSYDAILFDLYEGPHSAIHRDWHPLYGSDALARTRSALGPDGIFAVWSEEADPPFEERLKRNGFTVKRHKRGKGGRLHVVYLAQVRQR